MPEAIVAWNDSGNASSGSWWLFNPIWGDAAPYTRTDLVEAERAECVEVLRGFILDAHERTPKGEKWRISVSLFRDMMALLSKLEAKS